LRKIDGMCGRVVNMTVWQIVDLGNIWGCVRARTSLYSRLTSRSEWKLKDSDATTNTHCSQLEPKLQLTEVSIDGRESQYLKAQNEEF
jgi:hypothetical protein